jgi:hypothetical protein
MKVLIKRMESGEMSERAHKSLILKKTRQENSSGNTRHCAKSGAERGAFRLEPEQDDLAQRSKGNLV